MNKSAEVASTKGQGTGHMLEVAFFSGLIALYVLIGYAIYMAISALL